MSSLEDLDDVDRVWVKHDDHVGFLRDGELFCSVQPQSKSIANKKQPILVKHELGIGSVPLNSVTVSLDGHSMSCDPTHQHGPACGHQRIMHQDHFDYLVGESLHHVEHGACEHHGSLQLSSPKKARTAQQPIVRRNANMMRLYQSDESELETIALKPTPPRSKFINEADRHWYHDKDALKFTVMFFLTGSFFFVELIWGMLIGSLSLLADAMHMLSDLIALGIGMYAVRATKKRRTDVMTFGWTRMEEVGGLMNGVFLLALCLMLVLESLQRLGEMLSNDAQSTIESLSQGGLKVTIIAVVGLVFNLIGMYIFGERGHQHKEHAHKPHGHSHSHSHSHVSEQHPTTSQSNCHADDHEGHSHDDHSHGHDGHSHEHDGHAEDASGDASCDHAGHAHAASHDGHGHSHHEHSHHAHSHHSPDEHDCHAHDEHSHDGHSHDGHSHDGHSHDGHSHDGHSHDEHDEHDAEEEEEEESHGHSHANMNVQAVFLHLLGDALGSVAVLITGLVIQFGGESEYKYLADPICSLCITLFIAYTSMPLVKRAALGLLQPVPAGINLNELKASLMAVPQVLQIHELHVYALSSKQRVGSMHVVLFENADFQQVSDRLKLIMHRFNVHSTTVQPEFLARPVDPVKSASDIPFQSSAASSTHGASQTSLSELHWRRNAAKVIDFDERWCNEPVCELKNCASSACCVVPTA